MNNEPPVRTYGCVCAVLKANQVFLDGLCPMTYFPFKGTFGGKKKS